MQGEQAAILRVAPGKGGSGLNNEPFVTAYTTTSSAAIAIPNAGQGCWVTLKPMGTTPATDHCCIVFGPSVVAAAATTDFVFLSGQTEDIWVPIGITHFRVIAFVAATGAGSLRWYRSSP